MKPAVSVRNLSKRYQLGLVHTDLISEKLGNGLRALARRFRPGIGHSIGSAKTREREFFWALKDINFEIQHGEVIGVIGRNGAGKSTLLKILSRITAPTTGEIELRGRVASLLEVGTGFHPELTGRENIFMNGAILGMTRREIYKKFAEIVAFAEVEKFIDTPVKRYSSGMYVRLAFAVAAHLEPEILLVDEVLAVGDSAFQKRCLKKMKSVAGEGRTVLFVSHNMDAVKRLCTQVVWLDNGEVRQEGPTATCVSHYMRRNIGKENYQKGLFPAVFTNGAPIQVVAASLNGEDELQRNEFSSARSLSIELTWDVLCSVYKPRIGVIIQTADGIDVLTLLDASHTATGWTETGRYRSRCTIPKNVLNEGEYLLELCFDSPKGNDEKKAFSLDSSRDGPIMRFNIIDDGHLPGKYYGEEGFRDKAWPGLLALPVTWHRDNLSNN